MNRRLRQFLRQMWLRELLVLALVFKALVPIGYMPAVDAAGLPTLKLCAYYAASVSVDAGDSHSQSRGGGDTTDHSEHGPCTLGLSAAVFAPPPAVAAYGPAPEPAWSAIARTDQASAYHSPAPRSRLARGPPAID